MAVYPDIVFSVRANRAFLARAVRYFVTECGIRQFLDVHRSTTSSVAFSTPCRACRGSRTA